jgi:hypothetical protein
MIKITNKDLYSNKYDEATLIANINNLNKKSLLNTQILTEEFCANYIFCMDDIDDGDEDSYLFDFAHIMNTQPHLDENKLIPLLKKKLVKT